MLSNVSTQRLVSSMATLNDRQAKIGVQISSGMRITSLSDDAAGAGQAIQIASAVSRDDAFTATSASVTNRMQAADTALSSVVAQLTSAISTATGAFNGTANETNRAAAAQTLSTLRDTLLSMANSNYGGSYLFSGASAATPFSMDASGTVTYNGSSGTTSITTPAGSSIATSLPGSSIFTATGSGVFSALQNVITALRSGSSTDSTSLVVGLRSALDTVTSQRSLLNSAQSRLSSESDYVTQQVTNLKVQQSTLLSADTVALATQLSAVTAQRSALLSTIAAVQKGSLFDYL